MTQNDYQDRTEKVGQEFLFFLYRDARKNGMQ